MQKYSIEYKMKTRCCESVKYVPNERIESIIKMNKNMMYVVCRLILIDFDF